MARITFLPKRLTLVGASFAVQTRATWMASNAWLVDLAWVVITLLYKWMARKAVAALLKDTASLA